MVLGFVGLVVMRMDFRRNKAFAAERGRIPFVCSNCLWLFLPGRRCSFRFSTQPCDVHKKQDRTLAAGVVEELWSTLAKIRLSGINNFIQIYQHFTTTSPHDFRTYPAGNKGEIPREKWKNIMIVFPILISDIEKINRCVCIKSVKHR
jgi:hypothetical protein